MFINFWFIVHEGFKTFSKTLIKTKHISIMNLTFYLVFFILLTSCCFTSALKCYRCVEENPDADLSNGFCSSLDNLNSWEMVECSGSCFSGYSTVQGHRVGQRFINQTYFCNIICMYCLNCYFFSLKTNFEIGTWIDYSKKKWWSIF